MNKLFVAGVLTVLTAPALAAPVSPFALYTFDNGLLVDDSGNANTATNLGGVTLTGTGGPDGSAAASFAVTAGLSGLSTGIDINRGAIASLTMGAWVNLSGTSASSGKFLSHDNGFFDRTLGVDSRGDDVGNGLAAFNGTGVADAPGTFPVGTWQHVAVVYDGSASEIFLNGVGVETFTDFTASTASTFDLHIGTNPGFDEDVFGFMDDVFVYDRALTASEIADIFANGFDSPPIPLPAGLPLLLAGLGGLAVLRRRQTAR